MAQSLLEITPESLEMQLYKMSIAQIKGLVKDIYEWKHSKGKYLNPEVIADMQIILDIEKKETKLMKEMQRRSFLNSKEYNDFYTWLGSMNNVKKVF